MKLGHDQAGQLCWMTVLQGRPERRYVSKGQSVKNMTENTEWPVRMRLDPTAEIDAEACHRVCLRLT